MSAEVLFVDDEPEILAALQLCLRKELKIETAIGGAQALSRLHGRSPFAVVVADMQMPGMNGVEFLMELEKVAPDTVRIMLTGNADQKTAGDAVNKGHIFRFLNKPCPSEELISALRAGLQQYRLVTAERDVLERTLNGSARMLSDILAMHDAHSFGKAQQLREYMRRVADRLQLKQTWDLELAAMLSQIGCVTIPQALLERARLGRALSGPELDLMARAPQIGHDLLSNIPRLESVASAVLYQNKNFDGSGFPCNKIAGADIPIGGRILRVLQDLMALEPEKASKAKVLASMAKFPGRYDPRVLEAVAALFDVSFEPAPPGTPQVRSVTIKELRVGWVLASEARNRDGMLLIPAGTQISPLLLEKLRNFAQLRELEEPLQVTG